MPDASSMNEVQKPITTAPKEVQQIIQKILEMEKDRLDKNDRGHVNEDIVKIIKEAVQ